MKKLLTILFLSAFAVNAQVKYQPFWVRIQYPGVKADSTLLTPTFPGLPNLRGSSVDKQGAIAIDSTFHNFYWYDPSVKTWNLAGGGGAPDTTKVKSPLGVLGAYHDTIYIKNDSLPKQFKYNHLIANASGAWTDSTLPTKYYVDSLIGTAAGSYNGDSLFHKIVVNPLGYRDKSIPLYDSTNNQWAILPPNFAVSVLGLNLQKVTEVGDSTTGAIHVNSYGGDPDGGLFLRDFIVAYPDTISKIYVYDRALHYVNLDGLDYGIRLKGDFGTFQFYNTAATLDFPSTAAQSSSVLTVSILGVTAGANNIVTVGPADAAMNPDSNYSAWISADDTISIQFNNYSTGAIDPANASFAILVTSF